MGGTKKQKKKPQATNLIKQKGTSEDLDLEVLSDCIRVNLGNHATKQLTLNSEMKDKFNKDLLSRLENTVSATSDKSHDFWQSTKTPAVLPSVYHQFKDCI